VVLAGVELHPDKKTKEIKERTTTNIFKTPLLLYFCIPLEPA